MAQLALYAAFLALFAIGILLVNQRQSGNVAAAVTVVVSMVGAAFVAVVSEPPRLFEDLKAAYLPAGQAVLVSPSDIEPWLEQGVHGFVNLPIVAYLFSPFAVADAYGPALFLAVGLGACVVAWWLLSQATQWQGSGPAVLFLAFAMNGPIHNSIKEGNTSHIVLALLCAALLCMRRGRDLLAGVILGVAAVIKLPLLLLGCYFLLKGKWRVVGGGAGVIGLAVVASVAIFGWDMHVLWYEKCVAPFGSSPIAAFNAQSMSAVLARLQLGAAALHDWDAQLNLSPVITMLSSILRVVLIGTVLLMLALRRRASFEQLALEYGGVVTLACLASPLSWSHYYAWLLLPAALVLSRPLSPLQRGVSYLMLGVMSLPVLDVRFSWDLFNELYARTAVSSFFIAGVAMLGVTLHLAAPRAMTQGSGP